MNRYLRLIARTTAQLALVVGSVTAFAQNVELATTVEKEIEVLEKGVKVKKLAPPTKVIPGDDVIYTITYNNKSAKPAEKVTVTNAVPKHTRYLDGTATGQNADITFSVDGGKTFATPDKLFVPARDKSGKDVQRPAAGSDYTHIRWVLKQNVAPGQSGSVRFRAQVL